MSKASLPPNTSPEPACDDLSALTRASEQRFRAVFEHTLAGIAMVDLTGKFTQVNERYCEIVGRSRADLAGLGVRDVTHADDLEHSVALIGTLVSSGAPFVVEKRYRRPDGSVVWVRNQVSAINGADGRPTSLIVAVEDISSSRAMQGQVRESEDRFIQMAQNAPLKMWLTDASGYCTFINKPWCEYVGQPMHTQLGMAWTGAVHPDESDSAAATFMAANRAQAPYRNEYRLRRHDGAYRWHIDAATPRFGDDGVFLGYIGSVVDIHDQREAQVELERQVAERTATLDTILRSMPNAVLVVDLQGRVLINNQAAQDISGYPTADIPDNPQDWAAVYGARALDGRVLGLSEAPLGRALNGEIVKRMELLIRNERRPQGTVVEANGRPLIDDHGHRFGAVVVYTDIDERKRAEETLREHARQLEYFRLVAEGTEDFFAVAGLDRRVLYINPASRRAIGLDSLEAVQKTELFDYVFERDLARAQTEWLPALIRDGHFSVEIDLRHFKTGEAVPILWRAFLMHDPATGQPFAIAAHGPFLAERRRLEAEREQQRQMLRQSETRTLSVIANSPGIVYRCEISTWRFPFISDAVESLSGYPATYFMADGHSWGELILPEDTEAVRRNLETQRDSTGAVRIEYRIRHRDGSIIWCEGRARVVDGLWYEGVILDITERKLTEQALAQSEARFRAITDVTPQILWTAGPDGSIDFVNGPGIAFIGMPYAELAGSGWLSALHPDDVPATVAYWQQALASGEPVDLQYRFRRFDGQYRWHIARGVPQLGDDGRPLRWFGVCTDIEDLKRAQQAAEAATQVATESERYYRFLSESTPHQVWTALPDGALDYVNEMTTRFFGKSREAMLVQGWHDVVHPDDMPRVAAAWQHSVSSGASYEIEFRQRGQDGQYYWHAVRAEALRDEQGRIVKWFGSSFNIETLKRAQQAAEAATEAKSQFLANMSHEIRTPMNGVIGMTSLLQDTHLDAAQSEYVNTIRSSGEHLLAVINDILDYSKAEAGQIELERYAFSPRGCVEEAMELVAVSADEKNLELILDAPPDLPRRITGDAGRLRQVLVNLISNAIKFTEAGEVLVQVRVQVQAQPDGAIPQPAEGRWCLRFAVQDSGIGIPAERMDRLFGVFSQVDASHTRVYGGSGLGLAISRRLVERMGGRIWAQSTPGVGSTFWFEIEAGTAPDESAKAAMNFEGKHVLVVDDNHTNRRVLRLMLESWGLTVTEATSAAAALGLVEQKTFDVALLDFRMPHMTGVALARALRARPATQALPLMLLGSISGIDHQDEEHLFVARMLKPVRQSLLFDQLAILFGRARSAGSRISDLGSALAALHPLRILVAEDNSVNRLVALRFLERFGYRADVVANGLEAVQAVERQTYDVVLMDVQMPEMDGLEATREIRRRFQPGPRIIAVTANALAGDEQRCREAGMDAYIAKPINPRELAAALQRVARTQAPPSEPQVARAESGANNDYREDMLAALEITFEAEGARELIQTMHADLPRQLAELDQSLRGGDVKSAGRVLHSLKSTVRMVQADALGNALEAAEIALRKGETDRVALAVPALAQRCRALMSRLHDALRL